MGKKNMITDYELEIVTNTSLTGYVFVETGLVLQYFHTARVRDRSRVYQCFNASML